MSRRPLARVAVATTCSLALTGLAVGSPAQAAPTQNQQRTAAAADWQAGQLTRGAIPASFPGFTDWGLTIDTAFALTAAGGHAGDLNRITRKLERRYYAEYATFDGDASANAMAKTLTATAVLRANPKDFGGHNVRREVLRLVAGADAGREAGRVRDTNHAEIDYSNTFGQAFAVIGLSRSGKAPASTVTYLLRQQCKAGYFTVYPTVGKTCNRAKSPADVDATAMAVQALVAAGKDGADVAPRIRRAVRWLVSVQHRNGGFGGGKVTSAANSNSTGLVSQALAAAKLTAPRKRATAYVARMQLTRSVTGSGPARKDVGSIAYNKAAQKQAVASGISDTTRDQFRRATAQGVFAFTGKSLATLRRP